LSQVRYIGTSHVS